MSFLWYSMGWASSGAISTASLIFQIRAKTATALHLVEGFAVGAAVAAATGASCGALAAYLGHRRKTFRHRGPVFRSLPRFFAVSLLCVLGNAVLVLLLGDLAGLDYRLAQLAATGALLLATYHLHRLWTFS
ncbi:TPA: GtrA family protein [Pseudomonas aeruginosa]|nr:GtrA family protein [Pseudomonas aeruginosa]